MENKKEIKKLNFFRKILCIIGLHKFQYIDNQKMIYKCVYCKLEDNIYYI